MAGPSRGRVVWTTDTLTHGLTWFRANVERELESIMQDFAQECEAYMKAEAPWQDRTGDARDGLNANAYERGTVQGVELAHGMWYGRFLEFRFGGRDAIIRPTMEAMGPKMMARTRGVLDRTNYQGFG